MDIQHLIYDGLVEFLKSQDGSYKAEAYVNSDTQLKDVLYKYYFYLRRHIPIKKWNIKESSNFYCPDDLKEFYAEFKRKAENGEDLNPYLSKRTAKVDSGDKLLSYFGVYHFHLGKLEEGKKFVNRSGPLVFASFYKDDMFIINVMNHGDWHKFSIIQTICREFNESVKGYEMEGVIDVPFKIQSESDIKNLKDSNINFFVEVDGKFYIVGLGGVTSDGSDIDSVMYSLKRTKYIKTIQKHIDELRLKHDVEFYKYDEEVKNFLRILLKIDGKIHRIDII